jgi:hypothetical protein
MATLSLRQLRAIYNMSPRIRGLTNGWFDGSPSELLEWRFRFLFRRLVERSLRECGYDPVREEVVYTSDVLDSTTISTKWLEFPYRPIRIRMPWTH